MEPLGNEFRASSKQTQSLGPLELSVQLSRDGFRCPLGM